MNTLDREAEPKGLRLIITYQRVEKKEDMTPESMLRTWELIKEKTFLC